MNNSEAKQFRVLYRAFLFRIVDLEILSARADMTRLLGQFAAMLAALSLMFAGGAIRILNSRAPSSEVLISAWADEHFLIATTMAVVGIFAVLSWESALPNRRDVLVLAPLPVRTFTLFLAKLAAIGSALASIVVALNVFTGISYPMAIGLAKGGFLGVLRSVGAYWFTMTAAAVFMLAAVITVQAIAVLLLSRRWFLRVSATLQLAAFCLILTVYFLQPQLATLAAFASPTNLELAANLPSYWFLGLFQQLNGTPSDALAPLSDRAWVALCCSLAAALVVSLLSYFRVIRKAVEQPDIEPNRRGTILPAAAAHSVRGAIVYFCARTLARSQQHRIILAFYLGIGFAISLAYGKTLLYGLRGYAGPPWDVVNRPMLVATVALLCFAVVGMRVAFSLPTALPANWIFRTAVARGASEYLSGSRYALLLLAVAPVWTLSGIVLLSIWPPWPVAGHLLLLGLLGSILTDLCLLSFKKIPFTRSYLPGRAQVHVAAGAYIFVLIALADVGVQVELQALTDPVRYLRLCGILLSIAAWLRWKAWKEMTAAATTLKFEEAPPSTVLLLDLQPDGVLSQANPPGLGQTGSRKR